MAFFGSDQEEVRQLKRKLGARDLQIGSLTTERDTYQSQIEDLKEQALTAQRKYDAEVARAAGFEETAQKYQADSSKQALQITNLEQALAKAQQKENQDARGRKLEEQQRDRALDWQSSLDSEDRKQMEEKLKSAESRLREKDEAIRALQQQQSSSSVSNKRGVDPVAKALALENENMALRSQVAKLELTLQSSSQPFDPLATPVAASKIRNTRRPRSSSTSGCSATAAPPSSADPSRLQSQLQDLQSLHEKTRSELTKLEARASKAEREALKATNESLAIQKQGDRLASELRSEIRDLKEDLKWRTNDCEALEQQIDELTRQLDQAGSSTSSADTGPTEDLQKCLVESQSSLQEAQAEVEDLRQELADLSAQRDEMSEDLHALEDENERLQQAIDTPATTARSSRADNGGAHSDDEGEAALRVKELSERCQARDATVEDLTRRLTASESRCQAVVTERDNLVDEIDALRAGKDDDDSASTSSSSADAQLELQNVRMHVSRLQSELAEKDAAVEQAEALAEEDSRQLRIAHAEVKQLNAELKRFRQKDKESNLEIEVLRASALGGDSTQIEKRLGELRKGINDRDEQLVQLRGTVKSRDDELDAGKKQLKRIGSYLTSAVSSSGKSNECATPRKSSTAAPAATPISKLFRSNHFFSTPGGRPLQRSFDEDLLDQIELVRETLEGVEQQREFLRVEEQASRRYLEQELKRKAEACEDLEAQLRTTKAELEARLDEANTRLSELSQGKEARLDADEQRAATDVQRSQQVEQLEDDKRRLEEQLHTLRQELQTAQEQFKATEARLHDVGESHASAVAALETKLQASQTRAQTIAALSDRLDAKRQQLADIAERGHAVARAESTSQSEETAVTSMEAGVKSAADEREAWTRTATESAALLSNCRTTLAAAPQAASTSKRSTTDTQTAARLEAKVTELQARILRRNEQIGSQQLKIQKLNTRLSVAEEDSEDLLEEKGEMAEEITALKGTVETLRKERQEAIASLEEATRRVAELEAQVDAPQHDDEGRDGGDLDAKSDSSDTGSDNSEELLTLQLQLAEQQAKVEQLMQQVGKYQVEVEELNLTLDGQEARFHSVSASRDHLAEQLSDAEMQATQEIEDAKAETAELQTALDELLQSEKELVAAKAELQHQLASRNGDLKASEEQNEELRGKQQSLQDEVERLSKQLAERAAPDAEVDARIAELANVKTQAESQLADLQSRHRDELLKRDNELASTRKELDETAELLQVTMQEKTDAVADLEKAEHALEASRQETNQLREQVRVCEATLAAREAEISALKEEMKAQTSSGEAANEKEAVIARLEQELSELQAKADGAKTQHNEAFERLSAQLAATEEAKVAAEAASEELRDAAHYTKQLQTRISELEAANATLENKCFNVETAASEAEDIAREKLQAVEKSLSDLESRLEAVQSELEERTLALSGAESAIAERDEQMKARNEEYWSLKEEVAELQEAAERSRIVSESTADLQAQLEELQDEHEQVVATYKRDVERLTSELEISTREGATRESKLADLQAELERRKAASRSTQDDMEELRRKVQTAEASLQSSQASLVRAESQLQDAQKGGDPSALQEEVAFLTSRVKDLEDELSVKAEEVEEADTKILAGLKDSKKLAAKVKVLTRQVETLQGELAKGVAAATPSPTTAISPAAISASSSPAISGETFTKPSAPTQPSPNMTPSTSFSRKRSAPDEDPVPAAHPRPVYVDPPSTRPISPARERSGGAFMPTRKVGPSASVAARATTTTAARVPLSPTSLKDRTNVQGEVQRKPVVATTAVRTSKPTTTTMTSAKTSSAPKSSLMQALAAKRKLGAQV